MKLLRWSLLSLALICVTAINAQDDKKKEDKQPERPRAGRIAQPGGFQLPFGQQAAPVITEKEMGELKLSASQKDKIGKIVKDYNAKQGNVREEMQKALQDLRGSGGQPDIQKILEMAGKFRDRSSGGKEREDAEKKVVALLDDDQKKKFEELKKDRPQRSGGGGLGGLGGGLGGLGGLGGGRGGAFAPGQVLPGALKERLELTNDQQKKIEDLEKKVKDELNKILTDDQKKKMEQGGAGRPGGNRPRQPGGQGGQRRPRTDQE